MHTSLFDFILPESLIASEPANPRDSARMLVVNEDGLRDEGIKNFAAHLKPNDIVVFNNTRVIPARLLGKRGEANVEVLLHKKLKPSPLEGEGWVGGDSGPCTIVTTPHPNPPPQGGRELWQCFAKPAKRLRVGDVIIFAENFSAHVAEKCEDGQVILAFDSENFQHKLLAHGHMPLPPYIEKKRKADATDTAHYQTIYAAHDGSVAAPTAGLHFTPALLDAIDAAGATRAYVTLHVGGGTFLPVKSDDTSEHKMHSEWAQLSTETARAINAAKAKGGRVIAVGTTSLRTLESATDPNGVVQPFEAETAIFITPGYRFKCVDVLLTNFHLPRSTLFMLVSAFSGLEQMQAAYAHAIRGQYRFYSYGDACLLYAAPA